MGDLEIYPGDWYFNACVQGFLEVLEHGLGKGAVESFLKDDGSAVIPGDLAEAVFSSAEKPLPPDYPSRDEPPDSIKRIVFWWAGKTFSERFPKRHGDGKPLEDYKDSSEDWVAGMLDDYLVMSEDKLAKKIAKEKGISEKEAAALFDAAFNRAVKGELPCASPERILKLKLTFVGRSLFPKNQIYENLVAEFDYKAMKKFLNEWFVLEQKKGDLTCAFCGSKFSRGPNPREHDFYFTRTISKDLGSSLNQLPNFFWDGKPSLPMCRTCRSYLLCYHIVRSRGFFLNTGTLKANWYLNRLLRAESSAILTGGPGFYNLLDALAASSRLRRLLGGWERAGVEFVIVTKKIVKDKPKESLEYYFISSNVARWLLNAKISALLRSFSGKKDVYENIWKYLLSEKIEAFLDIIYVSLRNLLKKEEPKNEKEKAFSLPTANEVIELLKLYREIKREGDKKVKYLKMERLKEEGKIGPFDLSDNSKKNLVFRILELTRLGRRDDVYHILLRTYIAHGRVFPGELSQVFEVKDDSLFRTGVFAYIAGVTDGDASGQTEETEETEEDEGRGMSEDVGEQG